MTGRGGAIGDSLCTDARVRKISFTGSRDVGEHICQVAGLKRVRTVGGRTIAQDEESCVVVGMPRAAIDSGAIPVWAMSRW